MDADEQEARSRGSLAFGILPLASGKVAVFDNGIGWNLVAICDWREVREHVPAPEALEQHQLELMRAYWSQREPRVKKSALGRAFEAAELIDIDLEEIGL